MSDAVNPILLQIKALSEKDRSLLMATLSLDAPMWVLERDVQVILEEVWPAFSMALKRYDVDVYHYSVLLKTRYKDTFIGGCLSMKKYVVKYFQPVDHLDLDIILKSLITIITDYILEIIKIPLSPKTLSDQMKNVEYIVDLCFPGYRQNGMLRLIVRPDQDLGEKE